MSNASEPNLWRERASPILWWVVLLWVAVCLTWMRNYYLDDALIHLRLAENWADSGRPEYNTGERGFGSSSPLFVMALALASSSGHSVYLPKLFSCLAYVALLFALGRRAGATGRGALEHRVALVALLGPFAFRWLADGMETSLESLAAWWLPALLLPAALRGERTAARSLLLILVVSCGAVLLRIENAALLGLCVLATGVLALSRGGVASAASRCLAIAAGTCAGLLLTVLITGSLIPDTAVAKASGPIGWARATFEVSKAIGAAGSFGVGIVVAWAVGLALLWRARAGIPRVAFAANAAPLALVGLIALRGQFLQGVRHVSWVFFFLLAWNAIWASSRPGPEPGSAALRPATRWATKKRIAGLAILMALFLWEAARLRPVIETRSKMFSAMKSDPVYQLLTGRRGVAADIGFIGYFSRGVVRDLSGLVHGSDVARMSRADRVNWIMEQPPEFVFLDRSGFEDLRTFLSEADLIPVRSYLSRNLASEQRVELAVSRFILDAKRAE